MKYINRLIVALCSLCLVAGCSDKVTGDQFYTLKNDAGMSVVITNFGARIVSVNVPDKDGVFRDVVLGFDDIQSYYPENNKSDFGAAIGRYANRIRGGKFTLDGKEYDLPKNDNGNCLHGGPNGWQYKSYAVIEVDESHIVLRADSPDGENQFPGAVTAFVTYTLTEDNKIDIAYEATTDAPTVINMTNHSYFNLAGDPVNHRNVDDILYINASCFTPIDEYVMPTGEIRSLDGSPLDFRTPQRIGDRIDQVEDEQIAFGKGYDHNWILDTGGNIEEVAVRCTCPESGITLEVYTDEPGIQVYSGNFLDGSNIGKNGVAYQKRAAICFETQHYPDSPNHPEWPSTVLRPGEKYTSHCIFAFK